MQEIVALGKLTVLVVLAGSALDLRWAHEHPGVGAILYAWYPGEEGGAALADLLFGDVSPAARLPVTFPAALQDVPPFTSYAMAGRTYRYLDPARPPLYPFGYGLSYARFAYAALALSAARLEAGQALRVSATVTNTGHCLADEVVQLYLTDVEASCAVPHHSLRGFTRLSLAPGESRAVAFELQARDLAIVDDHGHRVLEPGRFRVFVGGSQPDGRSRALTGQAPLCAEFEVTGQRLDLPD